MSHTAADSRSDLLEAGQFLAGVVAVRYRIIVTYLITLKLLLDLASKGWELL